MINKMRLLDVCDFQGGTQPPKNEWVSEPQEGYVRILILFIDIEQACEKRRLVGVIGEVMRVCSKQ